MTTEGAAPALGARVLSGVVWNVIATVAGKALALATNFVVLWYLTTEEMGIATWALSIASIVGINGGMVIAPLVQRGDDFDSLESDGFWLNAILTVGGAGIIAMSGPLAARFYGEPMLVPLLAVVALGQLSQLFITPMLAKAHSQLRFKLVAGLTLCTTFVVSGALLVSVVLGAGAYAKVLPAFVQGLLITVLCISLGMFRPIRRPTRAGMVALLVPTVWLGLQGILFNFRAQGMHLVLGGLRDAAATGVFFTGYSLATQVVFLLAENLRRVLFPALVSINSEPERRDAALAKLCRLLMLVVPIACVIQAFGSDDLIRLLPARWADSAPAMFWLSMGLTTQPLALVATTNLLAQKRNRGVAGTTAAQAVLAASGLAMGAVAGDGLASISIGAAVGLGLGNVGTFIWALWGQGVGQRGLSPFIGRSPLILGLLCGAGVLLEQLTYPNAWVALLLQCGALSVVALFGVRLFAAEDLAEVLTRLKLGRVAALLRLEGR